jgi:hypothetical protein
MPRDKKNNNSRTIPVGYYSTIHSSRCNYKNRKIFYSKRPKNNSRKVGHNVWIDVRDAGFLK